MACFLTHPFSLSDCMGNDWYLSADMQAFLISPLLIFALFKSARVGILLASLLLVSSIVYRSTVGLVSRTNWYNVVSDMFTAVPPYVLGVLLGYLFHRTFNNNNSSSSDGHPPFRNVSAGLFARIALGVAIAVTIVGISVIGWRLRIAQLSNEAFAMFILVVRRVLFALCVAVAVFLMRCGYGGWVRAALSAAVFQPLSRLSFGAYLVHWSLLEYYVGGQQVRRRKQQHTFAYTNAAIAVLFRRKCVVCSCVSAPFELCCQLCALLRDWSDQLHAPRLHWETKFSGSLLDPMGSSAASRLCSLLEICVSLLESCLCNPCTTACRPSAN